MVKPDVDDSKVTVSDDNRIYKGTVRFRGSVIFGVIFSSARKNIWSYLFNRI